MFKRNSAQSGYQLSRQIRLYIRSFTLIYTFQVNSLLQETTEPIRKVNNIAERCGEKKFTSLKELEKISSKLGWKGDEKSLLTIEIIEIYLEFTSVPIFQVVAVPLNSLFHARAVADRCGRLSVGNLRLPD